MQFIQILQNFEEGDVLSHADIVEGLDILITVLNGNTVSEADAFYPVIDKPLRCGSVDEKAFVFACVGFRGEGRKRIDGIEDHGVALAHFLADRTVEHGGRHIGIRGGICELHIQPSAHESRDGESGYIGPVFTVVVRTFAVCAEMAHQIHMGVKVRDRAAGIKPVKGTSSGLRCGVNQFGEVNDTIAAERIAVGHIGLLSPYRLPCFMSEIEQVLDKFIITAYIPAVYAELAAKKRKELTSTDENDNIFLSE